jgi:ribokinase
MLKKRGARNIKKSPAVYDIISIGRPALDTVLSGDVFKPVCKHGACYEHIELGAKLNVSSLNTFYGGNSLNAAVTFARQNLHVAFLAQIGTDPISQDLLKLIQAESISQDLLKEDNSVKIAQSTTIVAPNGERVILAYPGSAPDVASLLANLQKAETRWLYISSLGSLELLQGAIQYAHINQVKVAFNPGGIELGKIQEVKDLLSEIEVLIMNKQEAVSFFGDLEINSLSLVAAEYVPLAVITDGKNGAVAAKSGKLYTQPLAADVQVLDRTGAGDAFSSGLVASLASGLELPAALKFAALNATSVVQSYGAQAGILRAKN